jgi:anaerobic magnesium-protoporphyrin IX monomethyl ester cyclase
LFLLMTTAPPDNAPWYHGRKFPPLGLSYVAAALEKAGFEVQMLDNYLQNKPLGEVQQIVKKLNPEVVGITCGSATYRKCIETAAAIKQVLPKCKIVAGGWHPSYVPDSILEHPEIDYVIMGEGERAMVELATYLTKGEKEIVPEAIAGLGYKRGSQIFKNAPKFVPNLDDVPFPARHLLPMEQYDRRMEFLDVEPVDIMSIIRGCPFSCSFCETRKMWGPACRFFSPKRVVDEVKYMQEKFGSKGIYFINDNFTIRKKETMDLCDLMKKEKLDIQWICDTRPDMINRELLVKMREAGCKTIWFGVESGVPRILEKINKHITLEQVEQAFKLCRKEGIQIAASFILGIPGETVADMEATFKFARKLNPDLCQFNVFIAYPDSSLYEEILQSGNYDKLDEFLLAAKTPEFDYEKLLKIQRRFHLEYNRSPRRILHAIRRQGPIPVLKTGFKLLTSSRKK